MAEDEHKSIKEIDRELAEKAEQLEKDIEAAEAKHGVDPGHPADGGTPPPAEDVQP